jgi:hypothetical protein
MQGTTIAGRISNLNPVSIFLLVIVMIFSSSTCQKNINLYRGGVTEAATDNGQKRDGFMRGNEGQEYKAGEVFVKFKPDVRMETVEDIAREYKLEIIKIVSPPNLYLFRIRAESSVPEMVQNLNRLDAVAYAEPNYVFKLQ